MSKLKNLFIKEDAVENPSAPEIKEKQIPITSLTGNMPSTMMTSMNIGGESAEQVPVSTAKASEEMTAKIWDTLLSKNFPGPDYLELKGHAAALENFLPSYDQRLLAAFGVLKNQYHQFTTETVISSIDAYIKIVKDEQKEGEEECNRIFGEKVKTAEDEYTAMEQNIAKLQKEIKEKQELLNSYIEQKGTLQQELVKAKSDMKTQVETFASSVAAVLNVLESDKRTISNLKV